MRVVFMGTPDFALPSLDALCTRYEVVAAVSQPDKPGNRGEIKFSPVKQFALERGIPLFQFKKARLDGVETLKQLRPDIIVTAAYGQILSLEILDIPRLGVLNVHASLLPKYRGSSPIQWAIINGEKETGVTIMQTAEGLDCGDILLQKRIGINPDDDCESMFDKLSILGAAALIETLELIEKNEAIPVKQNESEASYFPMLKKQDGLIDWTTDAETIFNKVRGMKAWPTAYTSFGGKILKIYKCAIADDCENPDGSTGEILCADKKLVAGCGRGALILQEVQPEGKRKMTAQEFLNGSRLRAGDRLG